MRRLMFGMLLLASCGSSGGEGIVRDGLHLHVVGELQEGQTDKVLEVMDHHGLITGTERHALLAVEQEEVIVSLILSEGVEVDSLPPTLLDNLASLRDDLDLFAIRDKKVSLHLTDPEYQSKLEVE